MRNRIILIVSVLVVLAIGVGATAYEFRLRDDYRAANMADAAINNMILYSQRVLRTPNTTLRYRFLSIGGEVVASADPPLNNLGLFSHHDYKIGPDRPAGLRIAVIGGEQTASSVSTTSWPDYLQHELRSRLNRNDIFVYNIGWPDAGPEHYIKYWKEFGGQIKPKFTIINIVESDYYRGIRTGTLSFTYLNKPLGGFIDIKYDVSNYTATNVARFIGEKPIDTVNFRNPNIIPSRPYGFFVSEEATLDFEALKAMQQRVVSDMIQGTIKIIGCFICKKLEGSDPLGSSYRVAKIRNFHLENIATASAPAKRKLVAFGVRTFGWLAANVPNVLFTHNFIASDIDGHFPLTAAMTTAAPHIDVVDMRKRLPDGTTSEEIARWYQPHMPEKWSGDGHRAYAGMVADLILERGLTD